MGKAREGCSNSLTTLANTQKKTLIPNLHEWHLLTLDQFLFSHTYATINYTFTYMTVTTIANRKLIVGTN